MERLLNVVAVFSLGLAIAILFSLRRAHIRVEYSVSWLAAAVAMFALSRSQSTLAWLSRMLGLSDPPLALLIMVFCVFLVVFYRFSTTISDLKDANIALAQKVAILEYRIEALNEGRQASQS
jgi:hypothetical protein